MKFLATLLGNRIAQMVLAVVLTAAFVGGYGWWQKQIAVAELKQNITVLKQQAEGKTADRERYTKQRQEAEDVINKNDEDAFIEYWNSTN